MHQNTGPARGQTDGDEGCVRGVCEITATASVVTLETTLTLRRRCFMLRPAAGGENFGAQEQHAATAA